MRKVAVITDSNCGFTREKAEQLGFFLLPMPFHINDKTYLDGVTLTQEQFYELQAQGADIMTSQPSPEEVMKMWDQVLEQYEEIVHIPMSSGLSSSCQTAMMLANDEPYEGKVFVVNNQRISATLAQSAIDAVQLAERGWSAAQIQYILEKTRFDSTIYITLDTLKYLKKGGRITPAAAALGTILRLKPVLQIQGEKLDAYAKARTIKQAKAIMLDAVKNDIANRFGGDLSGNSCWFAIIHSQNLVGAEEFKKEVLAEFPDQEILVDHMSLSVACHIGPGALAITCTKKLDYDQKPPQI
ncbi:MAG: DegV family protein [Clostridiales bacterium]|nr:DegV family protein [Clostridiales bacterium]